MSDKIQKFIYLTLACLFFVRCQTDTLKDIDGNIYPTTEIGNQTWMAVNLKTTRYNNGDAILTTTPSARDIEMESSPKYQWAYDGDEKNVAIHGRLYTWLVVADERNVCPTGWHVPTDAEWTTLADYLIKGGYGFGTGYSGNDISKSLSAKTGWVYDETPGSSGNDRLSNNVTGFNAMPSGCRLEDGNFYKLGYYCNWWTSTEKGNTHALILTGEAGKGPGAIVRVIYNNYCYVNSYIVNKKYGTSIRCIKDIE